MKTNRRQFLFTTSLIGFGWILNKAGFLFGHQSSLHYSEETISNSVMDSNFGDQFPYSLPKLPYAYDALEPFIDKQTMEIHHTKHHQAYVNNLNKALENQSFKNAPLVELFKKVSTLDKAIRNNGGGHYNHTLFWQMLKSNKENKENLPSQKLIEVLNKHFGSFENFKKEFSEKALKLFGSGWCWLVKDNKNTLKIVTTPNQDNPLMDVVDEKDRGFPLLGIDVWEHAYYLKYQNRRAEYIENFWKIINWEFVENRLS
ncbi:MAG: superoxide dismutase [Mn] [Bacteroidia bacterium]|nr:MAG: superoxide dismutase [Mn] [Bacteroidia bacterium]